MLGLGSNGLVEVRETGRGFERELPPRLPFFLTARLSTVTIQPPFRFPSRSYPNEPSNDLKRLVNVLFNRNQISTDIRITLARTVALSTPFSAIGP